MAALIPIRKTPAWWDLTQDERRNIFEKKSHHIAEGITYLPPIARQLYHSRDIGEPFDFLTWFEYAPQHSEAFEELVRTLRKRNGSMSIARLISVWFEPDYVIGLCDAKCNQSCVQKQLRDGTSTAGKGLYLRAPRIVS